MTGTKSRRTPPPRDESFANHTTPNPPMFTNYKQKSNDAQTTTTDTQTKTQSESESSEHTNACPECGGDVTHENNEQICEECGLVVDEDEIDHGPEWRAFNSTEQNEKSRVGAPTTNMMHDKGMSTNIGWQDRDANGRSLSSRQKRKMSRLRTWNERSKTRDSQDRNLQQALGEIQRMASALGLSKSIRETASVIYRRALSDDLIRGRSIEGMASAALYAGCRKEGVPYQLSDIAHVSRLSGKPEKTIGRDYRYMSNELSLQINAHSPKPFVPKVTSEVGACNDTRYKAEKVVDAAVEELIHVGKNPIGVAAAAVYVVDQANNRRHRITQSELSDASELSEVTIRNRKEELNEMLAETDLDITDDTIEVETPTTTTTEQTEEIDEEQTEEIDEEQTEEIDEEQTEEIDEEQTEGDVLGDKLASVDGVGEGLAERIEEAVVGDDSVEALEDVSGVGSGTADSIRKADFETSVDLLKETKEEVESDNEEVGEINEEKTDSDVPVDELTSVDGVGEGLAERIKEAVAGDDPVETLEDVSGVGPSTADNIRGADFETSVGLLKAGEEVETDNEQTEDTVEPLVDNNGVHAIRVLAEEFSEQTTDTLSTGTESMSTLTIGVDDRTIGDSEQEFRNRVDKDLRESSAEETASENTSEQTPVETEQEPSEDGAVSGERGVTVEDSKESEGIEDNSVVTRVIEPPSSVQSSLVWEDDAVHVDTNGDVGESYTAAIETLVREHGLCKDGDVVFTLEDDVVLTPAGQLEGDEQMEAVEGTDVHVSTDVNEVEMKRRLRALADVVDTSVSFSGEWQGG